MFRKVLIANRGAIACRIIRTLDRMGIASVAVYSEADRHSMHVARAGEAVPIGPSPPAESYLKVDAIIDAARSTGAEAIHPGYGFLAENPGFAEACAEAGIVFIGPSPAHIRAFGLKHEARELAELAGVPVVPGSGLIRDVGHAMSEADRISYPVMIKSTAGGGGIGLQLAATPSDLVPMYERVERLARNNFKDPGMFLEKYVARGRHIEVQIFGDGKGNVIALGERDCSAQRRNQKVIEETPAPNLPDNDSLGALADGVPPRSVGQLRKRGHRRISLRRRDRRILLPRGQYAPPGRARRDGRGHRHRPRRMDGAAGGGRDAAARPEQHRAEAAHRFRCGSTPKIPAAISARARAVLTHVAWPKATRVETWVQSGSEVSPFYDPMLAKIIATGANARRGACSKLQAALDATEIGGIETNLDYLRQLCRLDVLARGEMLTRTLQSFAYQADTIEVLDARDADDDPGLAGAALAIGRSGVPPSGPMDPLSFRLANRLVGNDDGAAGIETTLSGPTLKFNADTVICLGGAELAATLDGEPVAYWQAVAVKAGQVLKLGSVTGAGVRAYIAVRGGIDVPKYLGSRSTFTLGKFGGHGGRTLRTGDVLHIGASHAAAPSRAPSPPAGNRASPMAGRSACCTARTARRIFSPRTISIRSSPPIGRSTTIPIRPAFA